MEPSKDPIVVSDHAVLRYLERAMNLNVEIVREHILQVCVNAASYGAVAVRAEGLRFVIDRNRIVTVTPDSGIPSRIERRRALERGDDAQEGCAA